MAMRLFPRIFLALLLCAIGPSIARSAATHTTLGDRTCDKWTVGRSNAFGDLSVSSWAVGFISALNIAAGKTDVLADIDAATVREWVDDYCKKKPNENVSSALMELFNKLSNR